MKILLTLLVSIFLFGSLDAQKIQFKKDEILVDKVAKYSLVKTKKGGMFKENPHFEMKDMKGNMILSFTDSAFNYVALPHEEGIRVGFIKVLMHAPTIDKKVVLPRFNVYSFQKYLTKTLDEFGFFIGNGMTEEIFDKIVAAQDLEHMMKNIDYVEKVNEKRLSNYESATKSNGPLVKRKPEYLKVKEFVISEGGKELGKFTKGVGGNKFYIKNNNGDNIGNVTFNADRSSGTLYLNIGHNEEMPLKSTQSDGTPWPIDTLLKSFAKTVVVLGVL